MSYFEEDNQSFLFARGIHSTEIIASKGKAATLEIESYSSNVSDILHEYGAEDRDASQIPEEPGLYVWEGKVAGETGGWAGCEPLDPDTWWEGQIRPATLEDLVVFGISLQNNVKIP